MGDVILLDDMRKLLKEAHKSGLMIKSIISDRSDVRKELDITKIIGFPNVPTSKLYKFLCKNHQTVCMGKENFEDNRMLEKFFDKFPLRHTRMSDFHYILLAGRCILLGSTVEF